MLLKGTILSKKPSRAVTTKFGDKTVTDFVLHNGSEELNCMIWKELESSLVGAEVQFGSNPNSYKGKTTYAVDKGGITVLNAESPTPAPAPKPNSRTSKKSPATTPQPKAEPQTSSVAEVVSASADEAMAITAKYLAFASEILGAEASNADKVALAQVIQAVTATISIQKGKQSNIESMRRG
jgi:hypothetical protein